MSSKGFQKHQFFPELMKSPMEQVLLASSKKITYGECGIQSGNAGENSLVNLNITTLFDMLKVMMVLIGKEVLTIALITKMIMSMQSASLQLSNYINII